MYETVKSFVTAIYVLLSDKKDVYVCVRVKRKVEF